MHRPISSTTLKAKAHRFWRHVAVYAGKTLTHDGSDRAPRDTDTTVYHGAPREELRFGGSSVLRRYY